MNDIKLLGRLAQDPQMSQTGRCPCGTVDSFIACYLLGSCKKWVLEATTV